MVCKIGVLGLVLSLSFIGNISAEEKAYLHQACGDVDGIIYNCTNGTACENGRCEMPSYLTDGDRWCQAEMKKRGYSDIPAIFGGYCYISSDTPGMYEAIMDEPDSRPADKTPQEICEAHSKSCIKL